MMVKTRHSSQKFGDLLVVEYDSRIKKAIDFLRQSRLKVDYKSQLFVYISSDPYSRLI